MKKYKIFLLILILALPFFLTKSYYNNLLAPKEPAEKSEIRFIVYQGEGVSEIAERLAKEGLIKSALAFKIMSRNSDLTSKIQAGDFRLSPSFSAEEILKELTVGVIDKWVTLIEGWRVEEMAQKLKVELGLPEAEFLKVAKEGYMFPDTYLFSPKLTASEVTAELRANFDKKYDKELQDKITKLGITPEQGIILASIVEREGRSDTVRRAVASILLKRVKIGMKLDVDSSVQYAKDNIKLRNNQLDKFWQPITQEDYQEVKSSFNTYLNLGLPPAPISNPSLSSLQAVASADPSIPYLYYYHDSKGNSHYGETLEEHNQNVANYK